METGFVYKMREILTMRRVSGRWSPKCGSLPRDAGDLVSMHLAIFLCPVFSASHMQHISDMHSTFAVRPHHVWMYGRHPICDGWD